jgi:hypothetical protein
VVIAAGVVTILSPFAVVMGSPLVISLIGLVLTAVRQLAVGINLYKLGRCRVIPTVRLAPSRA